MSIKSVEYGFDKSVQSQKAGGMTNSVNPCQKSISSETNKTSSKRHHPNSLSLQSGILSNGSTLKSNPNPDFVVNSPIPSQSPTSELKKPVDSIISPTSGDKRQNDEANNSDITYKVTDSLEKIFKHDRVDRKSKKILMIGEKRMTSEASSSESRERDLVKFNKGPLMLKSKESSGKDQSEKKKGTLNEELAKKYADKLDLGKKRINSETRFNIENKENISSNRIFKPSLNILNKVQNNTGNVGKLNTIRNTPSSKGLMEEYKEKKPAKSPPAYPINRSIQQSEKSLKNKLTMMNFGKAKLVNKGNRNSNLKPPKKCYTIASNKNSDSESSFTSMNTLGVKNFGQEHATPSNLIRGSFEVKSTKEMLNNTAQTIGRNKECTFDAFNPCFNATIDVREGNIQDLCHKAPRGIPPSKNNMLTVRGQYKSKLPVNNKRLKKKDSSTTFRKMVTKNHRNMSKNKSSRARLRTVDSKGNLKSFKENKGNYDGGNIPSNSSSGKKKSNQKQKKSPK